MFDYIVSNWVAFGAFIFGLYWVLRSLCTCVFLYLCICVFVYSCICVLYRCRVCIWVVVGVTELVYLCIVSLPRSLIKPRYQVTGPPVSDVACSASGYKCKIYQSAKTYLTKNDKMWNSFDANMFFLCSCIHSPFQFPSISAFLMKKN